MDGWMDEWMDEWMEVGGREVWGDENETFGGWDRRAEVRVWRLVARDVCGFGV